MKYLVCFVPAPHSEPDHRRDFIKEIYQTAVPYLPEDMNECLELSEIERGVVLIRGPSDISTSLKTNLLDCVYQKRF